MATRTAEHRYLAQHLAHDYRELIRGWRPVARAAGLHMKVLAKADGYRLYYLVSKRRPASLHQDGLYVSTGIHGDEPAAPWGLLEWARRSTDWLAGEPVLLFPCLNPWGLVENRRLNSKGKDLNRIFHQPRIPPIGAVRQLLQGKKFRLAVSLHEDYDARGIYVYDLNQNGDVAPIRKVVQASARTSLPVDDRAKIEGRAADNGVISRRRLTLRNIPGMPETVFLFLEGYARQTLTFETPSEYSLYQRVLAHGRFLDGLRRWVL